MSPALKHIFYLLSQESKNNYLVGGCVRDGFLGKSQKTLISLQMLKTGLLGLLEIQKSLSRKIILECLDSTGFWLQKA